MLREARHAGMNPDGADEDEQGYGGYGEILQADMRWRKVGVPNGNLMPCGIAFCKYTQTTHDEYAANGGHRENDVEAAQFYSWIQTIEVSITSKP